MMSNINCLKNKFFTLFDSSDDRSNKAKINIAVSFILKGLDSIVFLLLVPATIGYLNAYEYGIWLTLSSLLMWINSFDIGLGNGLRNKLPEALITKDYRRAKQYTSTTFFMLLFIMSTIYLLYSLCSSLINWYEFLNVSQETIPNLDKVIDYSFLFFCISFVLKFVGNIFLALQVPVFNNLLLFLGNVLSLIVIYFLSRNTHGSLLNVAIAYSASPVLVYLISYPFIFMGKINYLAPNILFFRVSLLKDLLSVGSKFLILQISGIILFTSSNLIISKMFGPEEVTPYNISYRYLSLCLVVVNILVAPLWSASRDAYLQNDWKWIRKAESKIKKMIFLSFLVIFVMVFFSNFIYKFWVGDTVYIPILLTVLMGVYVFILIWSLSYSYFLNGMGMLKLQLINTVLVSILFIPIAFFLCNKMGIIGMVMTMCLTNLSGAILNTIQFYKIINDSKSSVWNK